MTTACETAPVLEVEFDFAIDFCWMVNDLSSVLGDEPSDTMSESTRSRLIVLEDGAPLAEAHATHQMIRSLGRGRYSHWDDCLRFATSDNTSPLTNGRRYELVAGDRRVVLGPVSTSPEWAAI